MLFNCPTLEKYGSKCVVISKANRSWEDEVNWRIGGFGGRSLHSTVRKIVRVAMICYIWLERN